MSNLIMLENTPKVSVITVCFNSAKTISRCIESVLNQTYANIEYIIIDGKSQDGTQEIVKIYDDAKIFFQSEPDNGISDAFNKGLRRATGEYIQILNADDYLHPNKIENSIKLLLASPKPSFVHGDIIVFNEIGHPQYIVKGDPLYFRNLKYFMPRLNHPTLCVSRSVYDKVGGFDTRWRIAMDYAWMRKANAAKIIGHYSPEIVVYMQFGGNSTKSMLRTFKEEQRISVEFGDSILVGWIFLFYRVFKLNIRILLEMFIPPRYLAIFKPGKRYDI